ncbi:hypothetical protein UlMin_037451 [Ulmus minor]
MPGTSSQNGVAERRNQTLKNIVRSMISHSSLPESLWGEALKTAVYILNRDNTENTVIPVLTPNSVEEPSSIQVDESQQPQDEVPIRRSTRERRKEISNDYVIYLHEHEFDMGLEDDPTSFNQVKLCPNSDKWIEAMKD